MRVEHFKFLLNREFDVFYLRKNIAIFRKPLSIWYEVTDKTVTFKTIDELLEHKVFGEKTVRAMIEELDKPYTPELEKGGGDSSGSAKSTFKFGHASGGGEGDNDKDLLPAQANTKIKAKTLEGALAEFKKNHLDSDHEWAYEVDSNGYVHQYKEGATSSVGIWSQAKVRKGEKTMIIHNHPSGGAFSDSDLLSVAAQRRAGGIIASGKNYDYKFEKGTHFKAESFSKAVKSAKMSGKDYNDAADKWLKKNQKKFGYVYSRTKN